MTDAVVRELRERIITGALQPGVRIDINEVATELGVSQTPVREAILHLEGLGLVTRQPYRGSIVTGIDVNRLEEITALRVDLEGQATLLGVPRLSDDDLARMRKIHAELEHDAAQNSETLLAADNFNLLNHDFHGIVYSAADSPSLLRLIELLQSEADLIRLHVDMKRSTAGAFHAEILEACERRDAETACRVTRQHLLDTYLAMSSRDVLPGEGILADVVRDTKMEAV